MRKILFSLFILFGALVSSAQIIVSGEIIANTTWTSNNIYLLNGWVYVRDGATLTIEPGTLIKGDFNTKGALIVERGAKLIADGTAESPIVFTSQKAAGQRSYGDWGGVILCGKATVNVPANAGNGTAAGEAIIEGGVGSVYGGAATPDDNDNSGILRYVRIEFGGIPFQPNSEINGLTMGGVGSGTVIENVMVSYSGDDGFEWFGGTVNCKNLVSYKNWDDDFDTDFGYRGKIQFGLVVRDPTIADQSGSNGFESDNDGQGTTNIPITRAIFSNITVVGPLTFNSTINSNYKRALHLRRNTQTSIFNSVFVGYPTGLLIDASTTQLNAINNDLRFRNSVLCFMNDSLATSTSANPNNVSGDFNIDNWFNTSGWGNSLVNGVEELQFKNVNLNAPDFTLTDGSPLYNGSSYTDSYLDQSFFTSTNYKGAFGSSNWAKCWTEWDPQNASYNSATDNSVVSAIEIIQGAAMVCDGEMVTISNTSNSSEGTHLWSDGSTEDDVTVEAPAQITLTITNSNGCSSTSQNLVIGVFDIPEVSVTANGATSFCTGSEVVLSSSHTAGNTWSNGNQSASITVTESGTYYVNFVDENGCEAVSNSIEVSVSDAPSPTISTNGSNTFCQGESVVLSASMSDSYQWYLNGNMINNGTTSTYTATQSGAYYVVVTNADQCDGVGNSSLIYVTANTSPTSMFTADYIFGGYTYDFNNGSLNATSYNWDFGDGGTSTEANPTHIFSASGPQTVTLTAINGDCEDIYTMSFNVGVSENEYFTSLLLYPNPASSEAVLSLDVKNSSDLLVDIVDVTGKKVFSYQAKNVLGSYKTILPVNILSSGFYFVKVQLGEASEVLKLQVSK
jgi:hypothetical protein